MNRSVFSIILCLSLFQQGVAQWVSSGVTRSVALGEALDRDASGNVYATGLFSCDFVIQGDTLHNPSCGTSTTPPLSVPRFDGYLVKYTANGQLLWLKQITGNQTNAAFEIKGISVSASAFFITGHYKGSLTFGSTTITNTTAASDVFVAAYDLNGNVLWVQSGFTRAAAASMTVSAVSASADGTTVITGKYKTSIVSPGDQDTLSSVKDALYLLCINATGTYQWMKSSKAKNSGGLAEGRDLWQDTDKNIFLTANVSDTIIVQNTSVPFATGTSGIFISKFSSDGTLKWIRKENIAHANTIRPEKTQQYFLLGGDYKNNNKAGTTTLSTAAAYGGYVARYDTAGLLQWVRTLTVPAADSAAVVFGVSGDTDGNVYATGIFGKKTSSAAILTSGSSTVTAKPGFTFYIARLNTNGTVRWLQTYANGSTDACNGVVAYDSSQVFITGYFKTSMRVDSSVVTNTSAGLNSFVARIDDCPYVNATILTPSRTTACHKDSILLQARTGTAWLYQWQKNGVPIPGATSANLYAKDSALYSVMVHSSNPAIGCIKYSPGLFITIHPLPDTMIRTSGPLQFCDGASVTLSSAFGNKYQWITSGVSVLNDTLVSRTVTVSGTYRVAVLSPKGCRDTSRLYTIVAEPIPAPVLSPSGRFSICDGDTLLLTTTTGTLFKYQWYRNSTPLASDTLPSFKAFTSGRYKTFVKNRLGCGTYSPEDTVTVNSSPVAGITNSGSLTACSYNPPTLYTTADVSTAVQWLYNGAALPSVSGTSYIPFQSGQYRVKLTNLLNCSSESSSLTVVVNPQPTATAALTGSASFCAGDSVRIDANTGPYSYTWQRNGSTIAPAAAAVYYSKQAGSFRVIVKDNNQCSDTSSVLSLTSFSVPVATVQAEGAETFCSGDSVKLNTTPGTGLQYEWFRNGLAVPSVTSRSLYVKTSGDYTARVYNTIGCADTSAAESVHVYSVPPNTVTANGALEFCAGGSVTLSAIQDAAFTYQWKKNNASVTPGGSAADFTVTSSGDYSVLISINNKCNSLSSVSTALVKPLVRPLITVDDEFISTSAYPSYQWSKNGVPVAGAVEQIYEVTSNGQYTVEVSDPGGCAAPPVPVTVCIPVPYIEANGNLLTATPGSSYQWYVNGVAISNATSQSYLVNAMGDYKINITRDDGCSSFSNTMRVCIPPPVITVGGNHVLTASAGLHYQWFLNGEPLGGADTRIIVATETGNYTVQVDDLSGCSSVSAPVTILVESVLNGSARTPIRCYPNPFEDHIVIDGAPVSALPAKASVFDTKGLLLFQEVIYTGPHTLRTDQLAPGAYILIMDTGSDRYYYTLIKTPH